MASRENRGLSGRIEVKYDWRESSSGHVEDIESIELVAERGRIVLREMRSHTNFSKSSESHKILNCIEIDVAVLMELIRGNGKKFPVNNVVGDD